MPLIFDGIENIPNKENFIKTGTLQTFKADVIDASQKRPVLACFISAADPACVQFTALLEKYVRLADGKAALVKLNIEECKNLAVQLGIRTVPTTFVFMQGAPADGFAGAVAEPQLKMMMQALIGKAALSLDEMLKQGEDCLNAGKADDALQLYTAILAKDETNPKAFAGMIRAFILKKDFAAAQDLADGLDDSIKSPELNAARTALKVALETKDLPSSESLAKKAEENPADLKARFDYAVSLFAEGQQEKAIDILISIIKEDKEWNNDAARQQLFKFFTALGNSNPVTVAGRRKLSSLLFS